MCTLPLTIPLGNNPNNPKVSFSIDANYTTLTVKDHNTSPSTDCLFDIKNDAIILKFDVTNTNLIVDKFTSTTNHEFNSITKKMLLRGFSVKYDSVRNNYTLNFIGEEDVRPTKITVSLDIKFHKNIIIGPNLQHKHMKIRCFV